MTSLLPPPQQRQRGADQDTRGSTRAIRERIDDVGRAARREGLQQLDEAAHGAEDDEQKEQAAPPPERQTAENRQHEIGEQVLELVGDADLRQIALRQQAQDRDGQGREQEEDAG